MGQKIRGVVACALAMAAGVSAGWAGEWPFAILRNYGSYERNRTFCERVFAAQKRHPGLFDEIWFGGMDPLAAPEKTAAAIVAQDCGIRERCRELGIRFSLQAKTVNHDPDDRPHEGIPDDAWIVDRTGRVRRGVFCCTSPFAATNVRERTKAVLAAVHPDSYWPDDDLRLVWKCGACPAVCFCDRCIAMFNARSGRRLDRKSLLAALDGGPGAGEVRRDWSAFNGEALGLIAKAVGEARDEVSPGTRLGIQMCTSEFTYEGEGWRKIIEGFAGRRGEVGIRPGGGCYRDVDYFHRLQMKLVRVARETSRSGRLPQVRQMCYEVENWPHVAAQKNANGMMMECACALAAGCDSIAFFWGADQNGEDRAVDDYWFDMVAAWRPYHLAVRDAFRGTFLGGVAAYLGEKFLDGPGWTLLDEDAISRMMSCDGVPVGVAEGAPDAFWLSARGVRSLGTNDLARVFSGAVLTDAWTFDALGKKFPHLAFPRKIRVAALPKERALATAIREAGYERFPSGLKCENVKALVYPSAADVAVRSEMTANAKACGTCVVPTEFGGRVVVAQDVPSHDPHGAWPGCRRHAILDALDEAVPGGMPARLLTDGYAVSVIVRKAAGGRTAGVFLVNFGTGETPPLELAIRRGAAKAWAVKRPKTPDAPAEVLRDDANGVVVRVPSLPPFGVALVTGCAEPGQNEPRATK